MRLLIGSMLALVLAGCASQPASKPESAPAVAATKAPAVAPSAVAPSAAATTAAAAAATTQSSKTPAGYKKKTTPDGRTVYCKKIAKTGSRFEDETCMSEAELAVLEDKAEQDRDAFRRNQTLCGTGGCGGT